MMLLEEQTSEKLEEKSRFLRKRAGGVGGKKCHQKSQKCGIRLASRRNEKGFQRFPPLYQLTNREKKWA